MSKFNWKFFVHPTRKEYSPTVSTNFRDKISCAEIDGRRLKLPTSAAVWVESEILEGKEYRWPATGPILMSSKDPDTAASYTLCIRIPLSGYEYQRLDKEPLS